MNTKQTLRLAVTLMMTIASFSNATAQTAQVDSAVVVPEVQAVQVVFIDFAAYAEAKSNAIEWSTILEANLDKFIIQRSINGEPFATVGEVKGRGRHGSVTQYYTFSDIHPANGKNVYRLLMVDIHGNAKVSETKTVSWNSNVELNSNFHTYPNPARPGDQIQINIKEKSQYLVQFFGLGGKQVVAMKVNGGGSSAFSVNIPSMLGKGFYVIRLTRLDNNQSSQQKIMVL